MNVRPGGGSFTVRLVGTLMLVGQDFLAVGQDIVPKQHRRIGIGGVTRNADPDRKGEQRRKRQRLQRRPGKRQLVGLVTVDGERQRHFARHDEIGQERMALAQRHAIGGDDLVEKVDRILLAPHAGDAHEPHVGILGLDAELALPFRIGEVVVTRRRLRLGDEIGIIGGGDDVDAIDDPFAMRRDRSGNEVGERRRGDLLQHMLALQRLHVRPRDLHHIEIEAVGLQFGERPLANIGGTAAPDPDLQAIFLLEAGKDAGHVCDGGSKNKARRPPSFLAPSTRRWRRSGPDKAATSATVAVCASAAAQIEQRRQEEEAGEQRRTSRTH